MSLTNLMGRGSMNGVPPVRLPRAGRPAAVWAKPAAKQPPTDDAYPAHWKPKAQSRPAPDPSEPDAYPAHWKR